MPKAIRQVHLPKMQYSILLCFLLQGNVFINFLRINKGHSQVCTQTFQNEQFSQLLKGETVSEEDKKKMLKILQKESELREEDEENDPILSEIDESLAELDLEGNILTQGKLTLRPELI